MSELETIVKKLESRDEVDAVFLTGSHGEDSTPYSDIDLVVILKTNTRGVRSLFTWIDGIFAEIFFFDVDDLNKIDEVAWLPGDDLYGKLYSWIKLSTIQCDKSGKLTKLKLKDVDLKFANAEKAGLWRGINYNFEANTRYFNSGNINYHEALEMRFLYSVSQAISGYFKLRDIPWRGEKKAIIYLNLNDSLFYAEFLGFSQAVEVGDKFFHYSNMVKLALTPEYPLWAKYEIIAERINGVARKEEPELVEYWHNLIK